MDKILLISDTRLNNENLVTALQSMPFEVISSENVTEGLQLFRLHEPFLVIIDCDLEDCMGMEFINSLLNEVPSHKYDCQYSSPPVNPTQSGLSLREANFYVIILSGGGSKHLMQKCRDLGVDYYLHKPIHLFSLQGIINTIHRLKLTRDDLCERFKIPRTDN